MTQLLHGLAQFGAAAVAFVSSNQGLFPPKYLPYIMLAQAIAGTFINPQKQ